MSQTLRRMARWDGSSRRLTTTTPCFANSVCRNPTSSPWCVASVGGSHHRPHPGLHCLWLGFSGSAAVTSTDIPLENAFELKALLACPVDLLLRAGRQAPPLIKAGDRDRSTGRVRVRTDGRALHPRLPSSACGETWFTSGTALLLTANLSSPSTERTRRKTSANSLTGRLQSKAGPEAIEPSRGEGSIMGLSCIIGAVMH
jgi:hypothetical protein